MTKSPHPSSVDKGELLPVTQADREAAAAYVRDRFDDDLLANEILRGTCDRTSMTVQAFARHRKAHSLPGDAATSPVLALVAGYADYKAISDDRWEQGKAAGYRELGEMVAAALTPSALSPEHCQRCGHNNPSWSAPSPLWNAVIRGGSIDGEPMFGDMVCAACFMELAEQQGIASDWSVKARNVAVPLETTTPSGRVWNDEEGLWVSALSGDAGEGELGRFGHHPDPAIDFCHEVECCENDAYDLRASTRYTDRRQLLVRIDRAMSFRVGGDEGCVSAKQRLRELERAILDGDCREYIDGLIAARAALPSQQGTE